MCIKSNVSTFFKVLAKLWNACQPVTSSNTSCTNTSMYNSIKPKSSHQQMRVAKGHRMVDETKPSRRIWLHMKFLPPAEFIQQWNCRSELWPSQRTPPQTHIALLNFGRLICHTLHRLASSMDTTAVLLSQGCCSSSLPHSFLEVMMWSLFLLVLHLLTPLCPLQLLPAAELAQPSPTALNLNFWTWVFVHQNDGDTWTGCMQTYHCSCWWLHLSEAS